VVSLAAGLLISLLQGAMPGSPAGILYVLMMGLMPFLFSVAVVAAAAGLHHLIRHRPLPRVRRALWGVWLLGNLCLLLDQYLAHRG
jgi:hypothetical protein